MCFSDQPRHFLGAKGKMVWREKNGEVKEIVADNVDSIICCSSGVAFSASALELATENNIQVVLGPISRLAIRRFDACILDRLGGGSREQFLAYTDERSVVLAKKS